MVDNVVATGASARVTLSIPTRCMSKTCTDPLVTYVDVFSYLFSG
jgi:hypothetical protein